MSTYYIHSAPSLSLDTFGMSVIANPSNYGHFFCLNSVSQREFYSAHWPIPNQSPVIRPACVYYVQLLENNIISLFDNNNLCNNRAVLLHRLKVNMC